MSCGSGQTVRFPSPNCSQCGAAIPGHLHAAFWDRCLGGVGSHCSVFSCIHPKSRNGAAALDPSSSSALDVVEMFSSPSPSVSGEVWAIPLQAPLFLLCRAGSQAIVAAFRSPPCAELYAQLDPRSNNACIPSSPEAKPQPRDQCSNTRVHPYSGPAQPAVALRSSGC